MILNTAIAEHKIEYKGKVYGDQRTVFWEGGDCKLELLAPKLNVSEKKKRKQRTVISLLKNGPKAWTN